MVIYKPLTDINEIKAIFSDRLFRENFVYAAYKAYENGEYAGKCLVTIDGGKCFISDISTVMPDGLLVEGLIRSALNFAANRNAYMAYSSQQEYKNVFTLLGFQLSGGVYEGDIPTLLLGSCCKKVDIDINA